MLAQARFSITKVQLPAPVCWASCPGSPSQFLGLKSAMHVVVPAHSKQPCCGAQQEVLQAPDSSTSAATQLRLFAAMQVANPGTATEAEADCKVAEEVWQALVWLSQWRSNVWPVLFPSLHTCSGKPTCHSGCMLHCVARTAALQHYEKDNVCSAGLSMCLVVGVLWHRLF